MTTNFIHLAGSKLIVSFEKNPHIEAQLKKIPGARFNKNFQRWEASLHSYPRLLSIFDDVKISQAVINHFREQADLRRRVEELKKKSFHELEDYTPKLPMMSHQKKAFELHRMLPGSGNFGEMGSGKCEVPETLQLINGELIRADQVWDSYAGVPLFDGQGWWASPTEFLYVNSMDVNGKIVRKPVKRLYKQKVCENLRKITLDDGSLITITAAHKLFKIDAWNNKLSVNDIVCVPRYLLHEKDDLDPKIAELFGWMVA